MVLALIEQRQIQQLVNRQPKRTLGTRAERAAAAPSQARGGHTGEAQGS